MPNYNREGVRMKKWIKVDVIQSSLFWSFIFIYFESILRMSNGSGFLAHSLYLSLLFNMSYAIIPIVLMSQIKSQRTRLVLRTMALILFGILYASQLVYFQLMKTYYSIYSAGNTGHVFEFVDIAVKAVQNNLGLVVLFFLPLLFSWIHRHLMLKWDIEMTLEPKKLIMGGVACGMVLFGVARLFVNISDKGENSPYWTYYDVGFPEYAVNNLGLLTTMRIDFQQGVMGWIPKIDSDKVSEQPVVIETTVKEPIPELTTELNTVESTEFVADEPEKVYEEQTLDIDFDVLATSTDNTAFKEMHQYFSNVEPTFKNEMTGAFEGYNLILITAEGFSHLAVKEEITPTLYKMMHEGIYFKNFYTPIWGVSTSDGEYVATTGLIPKPGVWSYRMSRNNNMVFALGNQLKRLGYDTKAYHNHTYTYYDRHLSHPNMGYTYKGVGNGLEITKQWPESDLEMMQVTYPEYSNSQQFHVYYMTVSGHMFYDVNGNQMASKNYNEIRNLPYSEQVKAYLATQLELEKAMTFLLEQLEADGLLDKTLIVISADHYPYGLEHKSIEELNGGAVDKQFELYRNALIVYSGNMSPLVVEKPSSSLDILPTVLNLMGLQYDSRLMMGRDIFSNTEPLVVFSNKSFITDKGRYSTSNRIFVPSISEEMFTSDEIKHYVETKSNQVSAMFHYAAKILETNYYAEVFK